MQHIFDIFGKQSIIYLRTFRSHLWKVQFQLFDISLAFFSCLLMLQVWSVSNTSYFGNFQICKQCLYHGISSIVINRNISYFLLVSTLYELCQCIMQHTSDMSKGLSTIYNWRLLVFLVSPFPTIMYLYSIFFLVCKLCNSCFQIIYRISNILDLWAVLILWHIGNMTWC